MCQARIRIRCLDAKKWVGLNLTNDWIRVLD